LPDEKGILALALKPISEVEFKFKSEFIFESKFTFAFKFKLKSQTGKDVRLKALADVMLS